MLEFFKTSTFRNTLRHLSKESILISIKARYPKVVSSKIKPFVKMNGYIFL